MSGADKLGGQIKRLALEMGFARVGVTGADGPPGGDRLRAYLAAGYHGDMAYMARNLPKRLRPDRLVPGAASVLCLAAGYAPRAGAPVDAPFIARYARGRDYHKILKSRCLRLIDRVREIVGQLSARAFVDSAPVAERALACQAGLGWIGRNGCLVAPGLGSYVLLCEIIWDLPLARDAPIDSQCESCDACIRACPTGAIDGDGLVDARRCISFLTIENRGDIPADLRGRMDARVFGCDRCQEACPHNRDTPPGDAELLAGGPPLAGASLEEILAWDQDDWDAATRGSATRRASLEMILRNAAIAAGNRGDPSLAPKLQALAERRPELAEVVSWALERTCEGDDIDLQSRRKL